MAYKDKEQDSTLTSVVRFRVSEAERERLEKAAREKGYPLSGFVRFVMTRFEKCL